MTALPQSIGSYAILRQIGAGGMGVVYEAVERQSGHHVALKTMRMPSGEALLRFKNEFRALADIQHPNLVTLGELKNEEGKWWFTMELVRGHNLRSYVTQLPDEMTAATEEVAVALAPTSDPSDPAAALSTLIAQSEAQQKGAHRLDIERLRASLVQLAHGLHALHLAQKIHRDVKPENVLVTEDGRVVILDFGLIGELRERDSAIVGTIAYMAPEQAAGLPTGPAADWYSVGVLLYEILTSRLPFEGSAMQVLADKQLRIPVPPRQRSADVPEDLAALCMDLLSAEPQRRPTYHDIISRVQGQPRSEKPARAPQLPQPLFIGRQAQLGELERIYERSRSGQGQAALLHGESGVGKSALMRHFAEQLSLAVPELIVLAGRCYERELLPYKAVDGVIDALSRFLQKRPQSEVAALLPPRAALLLEAFPVLSRVPALAQAAKAPDAPVSPDRQERRERVFAILRELFTRLAQQQPLLILIDDLQWTDADSLALLSELMRSPGEPALLLAATVRLHAEVLSRTFLDPRQARSQAHVHHLRIDGLAEDEALALVQSLLAQSDAASHLSAAYVVEETGGHPMFIDELVRYSSATGGATGAAEPARLEEALWSRILLLPEAALRLLRLSAVMGSPIRVPTIAAAGALDADELGRSLSQLRSQRLVRATTHKSERDSGSSEPDELEPYHDRIRETILRRLRPHERKDCHFRLADALEKSGNQTPETLARHYHGAGLDERAGHYAHLAAERAIAALAFDRAAQFYRQAIDWLAPAPAERRELLEKLGDALINASRGYEAAEALAEAAEGAQPARKSALRTRAADQFLRSGHADKGAEFVEKSLRDLDLAFPRSTASLIASLIWHRTYVSFRGLDFEEREEAQIPPLELQRVDTLRACAVGIGGGDLIRGGEFNLRYLVWALRAGEPSRIAIGLLNEAIGNCALGTQAGRERGLALVERARELALKQNKPYTLAYLSFCEGTCYQMLAMWRKSAALIREAESMFRERCVGVGWELAMTRSGSLSAAYYLGEFLRIAREVPGHLADAEARKDLHLQSILAAQAVPLLHLIHDKPQLAREESLELVRRLRHPYVGVREVNRVIWMVQSLLYEGRGEEAYGGLRKELPREAKSMRRFVQFMRVIHTDISARTALAMAAARPSEKARYHREVEALIGKLWQENRKWVAPFCHNLRAGLATQRGKTKAALAELSAAAALFDEVDMPLFAAASRRRRGELLGGDAGRAELEGADALLRSQGLVNPARYTAMLLPA